MQDTQSRQRKVVWKQKMSYWAIRKVIFFFIIMGCKIMSEATRNKSKVHRLRSTVKVHTLLEYQVSNRCQVQQHISSITWIVSNSLLNILTFSRADGCCNVFNLLCIFPNYVVCIQIQECIPKLIRACNVYKGNATKYFKAINKIKIRKPFRSSNQWDLWSRTDLQLKMMFS